jgi:ABC-type multidrug transport system permease subunit
MWSKIKEMKKTKKAFIWFWIASLFFSPLIGLFSILFLSYIEIANQIEMDNSFI